MSDSLTRREIDPYAVRIPRRSGLLPCLYVPVAARDVSALTKYVGRIEADLAPRCPGAAMVVEAYPPDAPDPRFSIWSHPRAGILHSQRQVWVNVEYSGYRRAYARAFPDERLTDFVLDHVMNRRVARLKGFALLRIVSISRAANSSHGGLNEGWGVAHHSSEEMKRKNHMSLASVQYADLADIVKMLDMQGGGSFMDIVNDAHSLIGLPPGVTIAMRDEVP